MKFLRKECDGSLEKRNNKGGYGGALLGNTRTVLTYKIQ